MGIQSSGCAAVDAIGNIVITGNITPPRWYKEIRKENGKSDHLAVAILSDIVYWYRPVEVRDESTGYVVGLRKKFRGDLLQKTYDQYGEFFGEKKRIIKEAMDRLEGHGLIRRIFRDVVLESGLKIPNVMYIEIFPERIRAITEEPVTPATSGPSGWKSDGDDTDEEDENVDNYPEMQQNRDFVGYPPKNRTTPCEKTYDLPQKIVPPPTEESTHIPQNFAGHHTTERGTNTYITSENTGENTTQNSTEITQGDYSPVMSCQAQDVDNSDDDDEWLDHIDFSKPVKVTMKDRRTDRELYIEMLKDQVEYDRILEEDRFHEKINIVDGIINIIADIATTQPPDGYERINGRQYPHEVVKNRLLKMDYDTLIHVLGRFKENTSEIKNMRSYLLTALYNARDEKDIQFQNFFNHSYYNTDWTEMKR